MILLKERPEWLEADRQARSLELKLRRVSKGVAHVNLQGR
jgi:hypothetical protein